MISLSAYSRLPTEKNNARTARIDRIPVRNALRLINDEDARVAGVVRARLPAMERAVNLIVRSLRSGGRLFFLGAGTSGRLGVMEAAECPPTFNTPRSLVQAFMAGGRGSVFRSKEGAEDRGGDAVRLVRSSVRRGDVVVGIAASGVTAFAGEGLKAARAKGAATILVTCHPRASRASAQVVIAIDTGPEVIAGSTRLKAATATKLVLNSLTVASMVQLGKVYGNRMVDLQPRSRKLVARAQALIQRLGGVGPREAETLFVKARGHAKVAIVMARRKVDRAIALRLLKRANGHLHKVLDV